MVLFIKKYKMNQLKNMKQSKIYFNKGRFYSLLYISKSLN